MVQTKMKVYLAAQTFSTSVADAIECLNSEHHPDFQKSEATIAFFRRINNLFDILNSRSPHATGYKAPMRQTNKEHWRPYLVETIEYLLRSSDVGDRPLWLTPKKTPFLGFVITTLSVCRIFDEVVANGRLSYFLTYKVIQDHLETYFCSVRNRNGWNNNPSALQFMRTFRKLLVHTKVSGRGGNCRVLDQTSILSISSSRQTKKNVNHFDATVCRNYGIDVGENIVCDEEYDLTINFIPLSDIAINVFTYIGGYVIKMLCRHIFCPECFESKEFIEGNDCYRLLQTKDRGNF